MKRPSPFAVLAGFLAVAPAFAESSLFFEVSNAVSPGKPSATIEVWADIGEDPYAFAAALFSVSASDDPGEFSDPFSVLHTLGTFNGDVQPGGDLINHILPGQIQAPVGEWYADTSNPILIWQVTWSTSDFTPRTIDLATLTSKFNIYLDESGNNADVYGPEFVEGLGIIKVVPAPGGIAGVVALTALGAIRRRR